MKTNQLKDTRIYMRVTPADKTKIERLAKICGLSLSEYLRQRALGYAPQAVPPDAFSYFCEKIDRLCEPPFTAEVNEQAMSLLSEMEHRFLFSKKGDEESGPPRSLLRGEKEHPRSDTPFADSSANDMSGV